MRRALVAGLLALGAAACFDDSTPTERVGGTEYNMPLSVPSPVRVPAMTVTVFSRTVTPPGNKVTDSIRVALSLVEPLVAPARYQLWTYNALTGQVRPLVGALSLARTDTSVSSTGAVSTTVVTTNVGVRAFYGGAPFNTVATWTVGPTQSGDTVGNGAAVILLTIQPDSTAASIPTTTVLTPIAPLWAKIRNQAGTPALTDDVISSPVTATFGRFAAITSGTTAVDTLPFRAQGFGRSAFWDQERDTNLVFSALIFGATQPPPGYFYQAWARDARTGAVASLGDLVDAQTLASLHDADLAPVSGTVAQLPDARVRSSEALIGHDFWEYTLIQIVLEAKQGDPNFAGAAAAMQGSIPPILTTRRNANGTITVTVTKAGAGVAGAGIAVYGRGTSVVIATKATDATGTATLTGIPAGEVDVRVFPPTGSTIANPVAPATVTAGQTTNVSFVLN